MWSGGSRNFRQIKKGSKGFHPDSPFKVLRLLGLLLSGGSPTMLKLTLIVLYLVGKARAPMSLQYRLFLACDAMKKTTGGHSRY